MNGPKILRDLLQQKGKMIVAPGAYDGISARLIAQAGFDAIYMTGGGTSASKIGQPDVGLTTLTEMVTNAAMIVECTGLPVIADADTGYGNPLNVIRTVREYERAGVAGIHLEDQVFPKRCGYLAGKQVVPPEEFIEKIKAAADARRNPDFLIIARTDARAVSGVEEAIHRANLYLEAGADVFFVEAPQSLEELREMPKRVQGPCLINITGPIGKVPAPRYLELRDLGYKIAIYPALCLFAAMQAFRQALVTLREEGVIWEPLNRIGPREFFLAMGLEEWLHAEKKYVSGPGRPVPDKNSGS
jgi:2-methylisocitrate lyase-like PEP mutase family enzyme